MGTLSSFFFTFGQMVLAGLAYWLRDWRKLQVVVCAPHFLFFAYSWSVNLNVPTSVLSDWSVHAEQLLSDWSGGMLSQLVGWF